MVVTVDAVVLRRSPGNQEILLVRRNGEPYAGQWQLPGGIASTEETMPATTSRALFERTGMEIEAGAWIMHGVYSDPDRDPRRRAVTLAYRCDVGSDGPQGWEWAGSDVRWFTVQQAQRLALAFDHNNIIESVLRA